MRVNVYAEEMTDRVEIIGKTIDGQVFTGLRFYLELPATVDGKQHQGPFIHRPGDDDSSAVTFWGKRDMRDILRKALALLDAHYETDFDPNWPHGHVKREAELEHQLRNILAVIFRDGGQRTATYPTLAEAVAAAHAEWGELVRERDEWRERAGQRADEMDQYTRRAWDAEADVAVLRAVLKIGIGISKQAGIWPGWASNARAALSSTAGRDLLARMERRDKITFWAGLETAALIADRGLGNGPIIAKMIRRERDLFADHHKITDDETKAALTSRERRDDDPAPVRPAPTFDQIN